MDNIMDTSKTAAGSSVMQIVRIATVSSVQILVLVIAGTSGFFFSLLGLIIPDSLKARPSTKTITLRRARSPSPTATSTPPSFHSSSSSKIAKNDNDAKNALQDAPSTGINLHAHPMSRGNSASSKSSTLPDLGTSSSATSSCSSSISEHHKQQHAHHHHHGMNATALYEGIVNRCKGKKATTSSKKEDTHHPTATTANEDKPNADKSCRSRRNSLSSPRNSSEGVRARLSLLIMPHSSSHSTSHAKEGSSSTSNNHKRLSYHAPTSGSSSPVSPQDGPSRSVTMPDVGASSTSASPIEAVNVEDGNDMVVPKPISSSAYPNGTKPPFLTRIFSFSSSSSNPASSSPSSIESTSPTSANSKYAFPTVSSSSSSSQIGVETATSQTRPKARRLSIRLASFRTASSNGSKSRRTISETETSHVSSTSVEGSTGIIEGEGLKSPPQTPRLGSLSSSFTPGSNGTYSPLRSPLSRRSFFTSSPSKQLSTSVSSPVKDLDITPQQSNFSLNRGHNNASPSINTTTTIGNSKNQQNRPGMGKRSASDNHTTSSFRSWLLNSSPSSTTRDEKAGRRISVSHATSTAASSSSSTSTSSKLASPVAQRRVSGVVGGETRDGRYFSDSAANASANVLQPVPERGRKEERRSLGVVSPPPALATTKPRQNKAYRSLSYAPPPSHSVIINNICSSTSTTAAQQGHVNVNLQRGVVRQHQQKPFVPFHPFLDQDYRASSLDLSGTSALTMSLHFSDVGKADP